MKKIVLFDLCFTLFNSNTTFDFITFYIKNQNFFRKIFFWSIFYILEITHMYTYQRTFLISQLKGKNKKELSNRLKEFRLYLFEKKQNKEILNILNNYKNNNNYDIFIVSASIDIVVKEISDFLGVEFFATVLEYNNDILTGKIINDILKKGKKREVLLNILRKGEYDISNSICYSDSLIDLEEWNIIGEKYIISKEGKINNL